MNFGDTDIVTIVHTFSPHEPCFPVEKPKPTEHARPGLCGRRDLGPGVVEEAGPPGHIRAPSGGCRRTGLSPVGQEWSGTEVQFLDLQEKDRVSGRPGKSG